MRLPAHRGFVWAPAMCGSLLDRLVVLRDRKQIEREAPVLAQPGTYPEPFALRALGAARGGDELLARADELFASPGLTLHGAQTARLLDGL